mgnify:CR=1 FL=1
MRKYLFAFLLAMGVTSTLMAKDIHLLVVKAERMHCGHCSEKIVKGVKSMKGVKKVSTKLETHEISITYDQDKVSESELLSCLKDLGYASEVVSNVKEKKNNKVDVVTGATMRN